MNHLKKIRPLTPLLLLLSIGIVTSSCVLFEWQLWGDINIEKYQELPPVGSAWETLIVSRSDAYSEIKIQEQHVSESSYNRTISSGDLKNHCQSQRCREQYEQAFKAKDNIFTYIYLLPGPALEVRHVLIKNDSVFTPKTLEEFLGLFRPYDTFDKVAALLSLHDFYWGQGKERGFIKPIEGGFEAIVLSGLHCGEGLFYNQVQVDYSGNLITIRTKRAQWGEDCIY